MNKLTREAFMTTSSTPEGTVAECKRRIDECNALLENTIVPEYRHALKAMAKAWMKIAHTEERIHQISERRPLADCVRVSSESNPKPSRRL
jgi:transcription elongation GreA/GreB family factor